MSRDQRLQRFEVVPLTGALGADVRGVELAANADDEVFKVIVIPALYVVWLSLTMSTLGKAPTFVGLANYVHALSDPYFWRAEQYRKFLLMHEQQRALNASAPAY